MNLATRLETEAPSRGLDAEIARKLGLDPIIDRTSTRYDAGGFWKPVPKWTTSTDAALALVREQYQTCRVDINHGQLDCHVDICLPWEAPPWEWQVIGESYRQSDNNLAAAICAALACAKGWE